MAKISTQEIKIYHKDIYKVYKVTVMYSTNYGFYIDIPDEFKEVFNHLNYDDCDKFKIVKRKKSKFSEDYTPSICAKLENECLVLAQKCFEFLLNQSIIQRDVIIIFFNPKDLCDYGGHHYNQEHPQVGMQFGLTYAVETSVGDKKVYSIYPEGGHLDACIKRNRKEIRVAGHSTVIIPDTKENREFVESVYNAFISLNAKLKSFMKTPESLIEFIESKQKLLI